jgi:putative ubiquitin-RnfH superfamily antitoxin RatB of RatAB toxin-antitoxin module
MQTSSAADKFRIEVAYALPQVQTLLTVDVPSGCTVEQGIRLSGMLDKHPEIDLTSSKVGIFGKLTKLDAAVREKDRIEIYRPLIADPKEVRRKRAEEGKVMKKGGGEA